MVDKTELDRLKTIDWLSKCGQSIGRNYPLPYVAVSSWEEANRLCTEPSWEAVTEEARSELTEYLSMRFPTKYQGVWNKVVRELRPYIDEIVVPKLKARQQEVNFGDGVIDCIKWDVLHALMTAHYAVCSPPSFYRDLWVVYEDGHFPCGWAGVWPKGELLVL
ncbi:hypothetical protein EDC30_10334 [Paucimonas lemoignei]|uniref:Uncharacterized protein n=1 Tax=Paucimonas lemoignei TaxID=29443 RepID=A0A4R3HX51_PAULE|nr:hypothetical protein [Paucimonas lemoignei]TCS37742.1 hypothetical protein EDC30_10334 [Paucimonas lemoignei]